MHNLQYRFYPVWDPLLRGLHWWNALTMLFQIATGSIILILSKTKTLQDDASGLLVSVHVVCGYMFAAGILTRILWLFVGYPTASWRDILPLTLMDGRLFPHTIS